MLIFVFVTCCARISAVWLKHNEECTCRMHMPNTCFALLLHTIIIAIIIGAVAVVVDKIISTDKFGWLVKVQLYDLCQSLSTNQHQYS